MRKRKSSPTPAAPLQIETDTGPAAASDTTEVSGATEPPGDPEGAASVADTMPVAHAEDQAESSARPDIIRGEVGDDDITTRIELKKIDGGPQGEGPEGQSPEGESTEGESTNGERAEAADVDLGGFEPASTDAPAGGAINDEPLPDVEGSKLESILESLLFATDRPLALGELKRLLGERDGKRITTALEALRQRRADSGIQLVSLAGAWQLRTHPENGAWVAKLVAGRPPRLSRAMMETLSIVAYRQPITRPEIDEIRGVDCGPVLRTLLDRGLIRIIGKKEEVGRPMLYGTTPEFLKIFSLRDLAELPTLREFHELGADDRAKVDAQGLDSEASPSVLGSPAPSDAATARPAPVILPDVDHEEEDTLLDALDRATQAAGQATRLADEADGPPREADPESSTATSSPESGER